VRGCERCIEHQLKEHMSEQRDMSETDRIVNRHLARVLTELEDAGCPHIFREAVKSAITWMRSDLNERASNGTYRITNK